MTLRHPVRLLVEGATDEVVAFLLLQRARLPLGHLTIEPVGGRARLASTLASLSAGDEAVAVLMDSEGRRPADVRAEVERLAGDRKVVLFLAEPNLEAWLLGDEDAATEFDRVERAVEAVAPNAEVTSRMSVLEQLASCVQVERAAGRIPALRTFLLGMADLLGAPRPHVIEGAGRTPDAELLASLMRELPPDEVAWRVSDGSTFTAGQLVREIEARTDLGRIFGSDLLRVARDLLARRARKPA
jgi:hypothetical protein